MTYSRKINLILFLSAILFVAIVPAMSAPLSGNDSPLRILVIEPDMTDWHSTGILNPHKTNPFGNYLPDEVSERSFRWEFTKESRFNRIANGIDVVVANYTTYLTSQQVKLLQGFVEDGGGLLIGGEFACYDSKGKPTGNQALTKLLGDPVEKTEMVPEISTSLLVRYGQPGTLNVPPGFMMTVTPSKKVLYVKSNKLTTPIGYWAEEVEYVESDPFSMPRLTGMCSREFPDGGRVAWFGSDFQDLSDDPRNKPVIQVFFRDVIHWLAGEATIGVAPWPNGQQAAVLIHGDIEDQFDKVTNLVPVINKYKIRSTFNVLVCMASMFPEAVTAMEQTGGELGIHGDVHDAFGGQPYEVQLRRIKTAQSFVERFGPRPQGLRPPTISYDQNTLRAAQKCGLVYIAADEDPDQYYPRVIPYNFQDASLGSLVVYPKSELDDYDLMARFGLIDSKRMTGMVLENYRLISDCGGLYKLNYHSQYLAKKEFIPVIDDALASIVKDDRWIAPLLDISKWVLTRHYLTLHTIENDTSYLIAIRNANAEPASGVVLTLNLPNRLRKVPLRIVSSGMESTGAMKNGNYMIKLPTLEAGRETMIRLVAAKK